MIKQIEKVWLCLLIEQLMLNISLMLLLKKSAPQESQASSIPRCSQITYGLKNGISDSPLSYIQRTAN